MKAGPATWGRVATDAYDRHAADVIVGEVNYGGAMVQATIQACNRRAPFKAVTSSRGKALRAEPIAALYEQGKVRHVGQFIELEDELSGFSTVGYLGSGSPNRADALVFAVTELFPGIVSGPRAQRREPKAIPTFRTLRTVSVVKGLSIGPHANARLTGGIKSVALKPRGPAPPTA